MDQLVKPERRSSREDQGPAKENDRNELNTLPPVPSLQSPLTPDVEFNEEEVLRTCQDFLVDYDRSLQSRERTPPSLVCRETPPSLICRETPPSPPCLSRERTPPTPAPRHSLLVTSAAFTSSAGGVTAPSSAPRASPALSREDEELLAAAQGKSFWEGQEQESLFPKSDTAGPEVFDSKIIRTRSSR